MKTIQGFSLMEVLISLILTTSVALALLHQNGQMHRFYHQLLQQIHTHQSWKNEQEIP